MSEENAPIRLSKIAREFNVGTGTIVDDLAKKGHKIDSSPNTKVPPELYDLLRKMYDTDRKVKIEAEKKVLSSHKKEVVVTEAKKEAPNTLPDTGTEELIIKNTQLGPPDTHLARKKPAEPRPAPPKAAETLAETPAEPAPVQSTPVLPEPEITPVAETATEIQPITAEVKGPVIIGKIDLQDIQPDKGKSRTQEAETAETPPAIAEQPETPAEPVLPEVIPSEPLPEAPVHIETAAPEIADEPVIAINDQPETIAAEAETGPVAEAAEPPAPIEPPAAPKEVLPDNFMRTEVRKLNGPVILGTIELPDLKKHDKKKPVASSSDEKPKNKKKKRKRLPGETSETPASQGPRPADKPQTLAKPMEKSRVKPKDKKAPRVQPKQEVTQEDIQRQIKETLASLTTGGKSKAAKYRKAKRTLAGEKKAKELQEIEDHKRIIKVTEFLTANELASLMNVPVNEVIKTCLDLGLFVSINQRIDAETISIISSEFGYTVEFSEEELNDEVQEHFDEDPEDYTPRSPIVTVMGHVDHGKTKLLDYIRNANVIAGEAGGITQHIGAYEVSLSNGKKITFLDTPGHEAFTAMRARGAKITDIAIIVIAADDSVMPQTKEAINHALAANVPIVFAINKIDKPSANPNKIREDLAQMNLLVEEWGGKYQCQEISAKNGLNIDELLEKVLLEAELLDLKANAKRPALGTVIESALDKGRGYLAKLLVQNGSLKQGDILVAGTVYGKVKAMYNERNQMVKTAGPSTPILVLGLNGAPQAGDKFNVFLDDKEAKNIVAKRQQLQREVGLRTQKHITLDEIGRRIAIGDFKELNIIVKGDVDGSVEALADSLLKLSTEEVQVNVIHKSVGQVTETDVMLASASNAIIVGFQVRPSGSARKLAEQEEIDIRIYSIIYKAIEEIKAAIEGMLSPKMEEKIVCNIEVREVFHISKVGNIAGCLVLDGSIMRNTRVRVIRDGIVIHTGSLGSLKRYKDDVKEAKAGQECGLNLDGFNDIKVGDIIEGFEEIEVKRTLK